MNSKGEGNLGGAAGGLLGIFKAIGTPLIAMLVGRSVSERLALKIPVSVGGFVGGCVLGLCVGGGIALLVDVGASPPAEVVGVGAALGGLVGLALSEVLIWLVKTSSPE